MNNTYKISIVTVGIIASVAFYINYNTTLNLAETLEQEKTVTADLKKNIDLLNVENSALTSKLSNQSEIYTMDKNWEDDITKKTVNNNNLDEIVLNKDSSTQEVVEINTSQLDANLPDNNPAIVVDKRVVDINAPFQGVDPASDTQQKKYSSFRNEVENYQFNERFDMRTFISDPRFSELHASLGVQIINYVDEQLQGVALMQDTKEGAAMLTEIKH